jgi:hypothetical protein
MEGDEIRRGSGTEGRRMRKGKKVKEKGREREGREGRGRGRERERERERERREKGEGKEERGGRNVHTSRESAFEVEAIGQVEFICCLQLSHKIVGEFEHLGEKKIRHDLPPFPSLLPPPSSSPNPHPYPSPNKSFGPTRAN